MIKTVLLVVVLMFALPNVAVVESAMPTAVDQQPATTWISFESYGEHENSTQAYRIASGLAYDNMERIRLTLLGSGYYVSGYRVDEVIWGTSPTGLNTCTLKYSIQITQFP